MSRMHRFWTAIGSITAAAAGLLALAPTPSAGAAPLKLQKDDHVVYVGNTLPDRMAHYGWLETRIVSRFADLDLVFRDLGYSGDEVNHRERCDGFGSPEEWLNRTK